MKKRIFKIRERDSIKNFIVIFNHSKTIIDLNFLVANKTNEENIQHREFI